MNTGRNKLRGAGNPCAGLIFGGSVPSITATTCTEEYTTAVNICTL